MDNRISTLIKHIKNAKNYKDVYKIPRLMEKERNLNKKCIKKLKIGLYVNSCFGFGDVIFTIKMWKYIKEWYDIESTILTTTPQQFINNGFSTKLVKRLAIPREPYEEACYDVQSTFAYNPISKKKYYGKFDCIFITPWVGPNREVTHKIVRNVFPETNPFNTFVLSPYNRGDGVSIYDLHLGIGPKYLGMLHSTTKCSSKLKSISNPYVMVHISQFGDYFGCFESFVKMICEMYENKYKKLEIILPSFIIENSKINNLIRYLSKSYDYNVYIINNTSELKSIKNIKESQLLLRADILPLPYETYVSSLLCNSLPVMLATGNQSVSDIISMRPDIKLFYQIAPWEKQFAKALSSEANLSYIKSSKTSCGIQNLDSKKNLKNLTKYDFEKLGKSHIDSILNSVCRIQSEPLMKYLVEYTLASRKKESLIKKLKSIPLQLD